MSPALHTNSETTDGEDIALTPQITSVQTGTHEKVMNVCRSMLETTNDIARGGAELTGIATGAVINATVGFAGGLLRGATGKRSNAA